jgi:hypothetical protein
MVEGSTQEWFLEVDGRKTGPFATDQILGLFADQEIPGTARVILTAPGSEWTTVAELAAPPPVAAKPFVPPPRPAELQPATSFRPVKSSSKPELSLMDALRVAKERRTHHPTSNVANTGSSSTGLSGFNLIARVQDVPRKAWLIAGTAAVLAAATWGMTQFIKQKAPAIAAQPPHPSGNENRGAPAPAPVAMTTLPNTPVPQPRPMSPPAAPTTSATLSADAERARENERRDREDRERDMERERDIASLHNAAPQIAAPMESENQVPPPPPPLPEQAMDAAASAYQFTPETPPPPPPAPLE